MLQPLFYLTALEEIMLYLDPERKSGQEAPALEISRRTLAVLTASSHLKRLTFGGLYRKAIKLEAADGVDVRPPATLTSVSLYRLDLDESNLAWIAGARGLEKLRIWGSTITDGALAHLAGLEDLNMARTKGFGDEGIRHLTALRNLKNFSSWSPEVTDAGALTLGEIRSLEVVTLRRSRITDDGVRALADTSNVTSLNLTGCSEITDAMLDDLLRFRVLKSITLRNAEKITCEGVGNLRERIAETGRDLTVVRPAPRGKD